LYVTILLYLFYIIIFINLYFYYIINIEQFIYQCSVAHITNHSATCATLP